MINLRLRIPPTKTEIAGMIFGKVLIGTIKYTAIALIFWGCYKCVVSK